MRKINIFLFLLGIFFFLFIASPILADTGNETYPVYQGILVEITAMDLLQAKFTDIKALDIKQTADNYPNFYFTVKETISGADAQAWGKAANLVAVFYRPLLTTHGYKTEVIEYKDISGRTQATYYRNNYMLIVTGPDKEKVTNLINVIADILS